MYAEVIVPLKVPSTLTYSVPAGMSVSAGCRVQVPVGDNRTYFGIVVRTLDDKPEATFKLKDIATADPLPAATAEQIKLWQWVADYYLCPIGDVMRCAIPSKLKTAKRRAKPQCPSTGQPRPPIAPLTAAQARALKAINDDTHPITLLHGATASGKTLIYEHLMSQCAARGSTCLYLVPEIALTTQLEERLRRVFGQDIAVYHSKMTEAQRCEVWERQLSDSPYPIILGARSSVFLPMPRLAMVIIDEEHEASYKQQEPSPRYHARNAALMMASFAGAKVVLGSATPSMESYWHARKGHYGLVELTERYQERAADSSTLVVDTGELRRKKLMKGLISPPLKEAMAEALERGEQVILFQNRRGYAPHVECRECGWTPRCLRCDVSLTMHRRMSVMVCHTCGAQYGVPAKCPKCGSTDLRPHGAGTEKVEEEVRKLFPQARVSRLDLDAAKTKEDFATIVGDFASGGADILIGTQMVTKGLDFLGVSVVGILSADTALNAPDFRAYERAYELMAQVAGRAGRAGLPATVVIQTRQADSTVIRHVVEGNWLAHYKEVMQERLDFCYPPFCRLVAIYVRHRYEAVAQEVAQSLAARINKAALTGVEVLGPDAPDKARVSNMYIQKAVVKIRPEANLTTAKSLLLGLFWEYLHSPVGRQALIVFDCDPMT